MECYYDAKELLKIFNQCEKEYMLWLEEQISVWHYPLKIDKT